MANQILNPEKMKLYKPDQYYQTSAGVFLKDGVAPIAGSTKNVNRDASSLQGTLPAENGTASVNTSVGLPISGLDALRQMMKATSDAASAAAMNSGTKTAFKGFEAMGVTPEKVSGNFVADVINFVNQSTQPTIQDEFTTMMSTIDSIEKYQTEVKQSAIDLIDKSIANGMWQKMDDAQRQKIWSSAGYTGTPIVTKNLEFYQSEDARGHVWNIGYDANTGEIVRKDDLGLLGTPSSSGGGGNTPAEDELKVINAFKSDLVDPKSVGIAGRIATRGQEKPANGQGIKNDQGENISDYTTREQLIAKLQAKWGHLIASEDIAQSVYDAYPD